MTDKIDTLSKTALFSNLQLTELTELAEHAVEHSLAQGEMLFLAGEESKGLYVIVRGALRAFRESLDGREQVIHVEHAGATIAEVPVFDDLTYPSSVVAEEPTTVLFIDKKEVRQLCLKYPQIALAALKVLATRLRRCSDLVESLSLHEVDQRLAKFLLTEAQLHGKQTSNGLTVDLVLTNQQIASRIGSVREVISRALNRLQQNGLIIVNSRQIVIPDEKVLLSYIGG